MPNTIKIRVKATGQIAEVTAQTVASMVPQYADLVAGEPDTAPVQIDATGRQEQSIDGHDEPEAHE